ncbi:hypothetical protein BY458DRAFT_439368 [Sporodiniella umbellata]|nr:hypothetical protein BY458DRAFT_439368 [Sporodiniella umbellata]
MKSSILFLAICLLNTFHSVHAYYYLASLANSLPFKGMMASARSNNTLYIFGGENATSHYTNDLYKLTRTSDGFTWSSVPQTNPIPGTASSQAYITADQQNLVLLGGMSAATVGKVAPLQINTFNFASQTWTSNTQPNQTIDANFVYNREAFSANYDSASQATYIFGGDNTSAVFSTLHKLDSSFHTTALPSPQEARYGHAGAVTSSGELVIVGGVNAGGLASMKSVMVYDIKKGEWRNQNLNGQNGLYPSPSSDLSAVVNSKDQIIIFGGNNRAVERKRQYLSAVAILDTKSWTWTIPVVNGIPPSRRAFAVAGIFDDNYLTIAFGGALNNYYNDVNVFDLSTHAWLQSFGASSNNSSSISKGVIAGVTVAAVVLLAIVLFLLWKFQRYFRWFVARIHHDIWKPRTGEPIWAETSRLISQVFFLFIFVMFLYFVIRQAVDSPNVTQRIQSPSASVNVPDVRFCYDGFPDKSAMMVNGDDGSPGVACMTDNGYSCTRYVQPLDMSVFQPTFSDSLGAVHCFLFRAPDDFQLTSTSGANNGSRLLFTLFGDTATNYGRVHLSVFPKNMDPNAKVYNTNDNIPVYMSEADVLNWQNAERNDLQSENVFTIAPSTYSALSYDVVDHRFLQPVGWNYVGFLPITNSTPQIETYFRSEAPNPNYTQTHGDLGVIAIYPHTWGHLMDREVKMYTLVNALGFVGGIFGMLIAVQAWLFGFRPRSPWGVVHRWSTGSRKQSLLSGLQSKFKTSDSGIPLVHPVSHRFSTNEFENLRQETEAQRVSRVEERMQVLELLFKAYYVDDEVFRSLDNANTDTKDSLTATTPSTLAGNPFFASSEKVPQHKPDGFSHMFNERQSQGSISSDATSQHHLNNPTDDFKLTFQHSTEWPIRGGSAHLLVLDASFNPPTLAHRALVWRALAASADCDSILLLFSTQNADKVMTGANVQQRLAMMQCIASEDPRMAVGVTRHGKFVDKAQAIFEAYGRSAVQLSFILGYDTLTRLMDPSYYRPISWVQALTPFLSQCRLLCADRGEEDPLFWARIHQAFPTLLIQRITLDPQLAGLSSTLAREKVKMGESLEHVLQPEIARLIQTYGLYQA